jgi:hypothetical protein
VTDVKTNDPHNAAKKPKTSMSETMWNGVFMVGGALLAAVFGILQSRWQRRTQVRDEFSDMIDERFAMLESESFQAKTVYDCSIVEFQTFIRKLNGSLCKCTRRKLEKEWGKYKQMGEFPETVTKEKIAESWNNFKRITSVWF